jgi:hypothetical protein
LGKAQRGALRQARLLVALRLEMFARHQSVQRQEQQLEL